MTFDLSAGPEKTSQILGLYNSALLHKDSQENRLFTQSTGT